MRRKNRQHNNMSSDFDEKLTPDAEQLDNYLYRYKDTISRKQALERRREEIRKEFTPIKSPKMDGMPHSGASGDGIAVALLIKLDEIDEMIAKQRTTAAKILADIMNIIDLLPEETSEDILAKDVLEARYIDRMRWERVCSENNISRSKANRSWKKGLYSLLDFKKVRKTLREFYGEGEEDNGSMDHAEQSNEDLP